MGKKQFCFFQTAETGNRTPDSGVKGSGANHYPRAPAPDGHKSILGIQMKQKYLTKDIYADFKLKNKLVSWFIQTNFTL